MRAALVILLSIAPAAGAFHTPTGQPDPPTCALFPAGPLNGDVYAGPVEVSITSDGPDFTRYSVDGAPEADYVEPFAVEGDGEHTVTCHTQSFQEFPGWGSEAFEIRTAPSCTGAFDGGDSWAPRGGNVSFAGDVVDWTLDGGPAQAYAGPFLVDAEGSHEVVCRGRWPSGRTSFGPPLLVRIDRSPPWCEAVVTPAAGNRSATPTIRAGDDRSGVAEAALTVDGAASDGAAITAAGPHVARCRVVDAAGNVFENETGFAIAATGPASSNDAPGEGEGDAGDGGDDVGSDPGGTSTGGTSGGGTSSGGSGGTGGGNASASSEDDAFLGIPAAPLFAAVAVAAAAAMRRR